MWSGRGQVERRGGGGGQAAGVQVGHAGLLDERLDQRAGADAPAGVGVVSLAGQGDRAAVREDLLRPGPVPRLLDWVVGAVERQQRDRRYGQLVMAYRVG